MPHVEICRHGQCVRFVWTATILMIGHFSIVSQAAEVLHLSSSYIRRHENHVKRSEPALETGLSGPPGPRGDSGSQAGPIGLSGDPGDGDPGTVGSRGLPYVGVAPAGSIGDTGLPGDDIRTQGDPGSSGTIVDCTWGQWGGFSNCTGICGSGFQRRERHWANSPNFGGKSCTGSSFDIANCRLPPCNTFSTNCVWSTWSLWDTCSQTCGTGQQHQERWVVTLPQNGGTDCTGNAIVIQSCATQPCITSANGNMLNVPCALNSWNAWEPCTRTCGRGETRRYRSIATYPLGNGTTCGPTYQYTSCNSQLCSAGVINCVWSDWQPWGICSATCGEGVQRRDRWVEVYPINSGTNCNGGSFARRACRASACPSQTLPVSNTVGTITTTQLYVEALPAQIPGKQGRIGANGARQSQGPMGYRGALGVQGPQGFHGDDGSAAVVSIRVNGDCEWSDWILGTCTASCGGGLQTVSRYIAQFPSGSGSSCTGSTYLPSERCNTQVCLDLGRTITVFDAAGTALQGGVKLQVSNTSVKTVTAGARAITATGVLAGRGGGSPSSGVDTSSRGSADGHAATSASVSVDAGGAPDRAPGA